MSNQIKRSIFLTQKKARDLAFQELGTHYGLNADSKNTANYQLYEMHLGSHIVKIYATVDYPGMVFLTFGGETTVFDMYTFERNEELTELERQAFIKKTIEYVVSCKSLMVFNEIITQFGADYCISQIKSIADKL